MASDLYSAAWDFGRLNLGAVGGANAAVFASATGGPAGNLGYTSGMYMHATVGMTASATIDGVTLAPFTSGIDALVGGSALTVAFDRAALTYTLSAANTFTVTWSGAQGTALRDILGFEATLTPAATSWTSTKRPKYLIASRIAGQSAVHDYYKRPGTIAQAIAESGFQYSTRPDTTATYRDWTQPFETNTGPTDAEWTANKAVGGAPMRTTDLGVATKVWWSWEEFYDHVAAELPFALIPTGTTIGPVFKLDADSAHFDPARVTADYDGHWSPALKTLYKGALVVV